MGETNSFYVLYVMKINENTFLKICTNIFYVLQVMCAAVKLQRKKSQEDEVMHILMCLFSFCSK